jgi:hypothetical protein
MDGDSREIAISGTLWFIAGLYASEHFQEPDLIYETKHRYQWLTRHGDKVASEVDNAIR